MSTIECKFVLEYKNKRNAKMIKESLEPDNENYIVIKQEGRKLEATCEGKTPMELLHTIDDFLSCLTITEDSVDRF